MLMRQQKKQLIKHYTYAAQIGNIHRILSSVFAKETNNLDVYLSGN